MESISESGSKVKQIGELSPGREDRATVETDLSARSGPSGVSSPVPDLDTLPRLSDCSPDGSNAINSPTTVLSPETADTDSLDTADSSSSPSVGLSDLRYVNSNNLISEVLDAYRQYCSKLEHTPCAFLHLRHKEDGSTALFRVNATSSSRYFQQGRAQKIKSIRQRLNGEWKRGVFFTLTVDAKRYSLTDVWPSMWPQFNRFKTSLNQYRKTHMNAGHGILYLAALEAHKSDYPHLHVYCPGLRWLIKKQDLGKMDNWWGMGSVQTQKELRRDSAGSYIMKYISKMDGWSETSLAMIWHFKIRIYNLSHRYRTGESRSEWELLGRYGDAESLSEGLGIGFRAAEALIEAWADMDDNLVYLS